MNIIDKIANTLGLYKDEYDDELKEKEEILPEPKRRLTNNSERKKARSSRFSAKRTRVKTAS
jgi:hypothetical protein